jgi:peptidoglycan hydrolase CwlO-like protein
MNFFKALLSINSLREQNKQLEQTNLELATHNLQLQSQIVSVRSLIDDQSHTINKLRSDNGRMHSELSQIKSLKRNQKPNVSAPSMSAPAPKQKNPSQPSNNQQNQSRRGRKPKTANQ